MTLNQKYYGGAVAVILAVLVGTIVAYPALPNIVPMHWDVHGNINGWGPKWSLFIFGPGMLTAMTLLFWALPWLSPKKFAVDTFRATYLYIMIVIVAMLAYCHLLVLASALSSRSHTPLDVSRAIVGGICLLLALLGNVLGKVRRNFFVGIRTPWTLADERVWTETHRVAAHQWFVGGTIGALLTLVGVPVGIMIAYFMIMALLPVPMSFLIYKRLNPRGS